MLTWKMFMTEIRKRQKQENILFSKMSKWKLNKKLHACFVPSKQKKVMRILSLLLNRSKLKVKLDAGGMG